MKNTNKDQNRKETIDRIRVDTFEVQTELQSYSALFSNLGNDPITGSSLHGISFIFNRLDRKFDDINEALDKIY